MDLKQIRKLVQEQGSVVLVEEGQVPLVIRELPGQSVSATVAPIPAEEVPIASRWPKGRSVLESRQEQILERLNAEILALKSQIAEEEAGAN